MIAKTFWGLPVSVWLALLGGLLIFLVFKNFLPKRKEIIQTNEEEEPIISNIKWSIKFKTKEDFEKGEKELKLLTEGDALEIPAIMANTCRRMAQMLGVKTPKNKMVEYWEYYSLPNAETLEVFVLHRISNIPNSPIIINKLREFQRKGSKDVITNNLSEIGLTDYQITLLA